MFAKICAIISVLFLVFSVNSGYATEIHLFWDANSESDLQGYRIYMGTQVNMTSWTWEQVGDVNATVTDFIFIDVPDALRLFRISAYDTAGQENIRYNAGIFSCLEWAPPAEPVGTGIE